NRRSIENLKSDGFTSRFTGGPNMTPERRWNVYVRWSADTVGMAEAMSGTIWSPSPPAAFLKVSRPLFVASSVSQPSLVYESAVSRWSGLSGMAARRVPPRTGLPDALPPPVAPPLPPQPAARPAIAMAAAIHRVLI